MGWMLLLICSDTNQPGMVGKDLWIVYMTLDEVGFFAIKFSNKQLLLSASYEHGTV